MAEPSRHNSPRRTPLRSGTADSQDSVVFRRRRSVVRAGNLLTTRGKPVAAILDAVNVQAERPLSSPPLSQSLPNGHTRGHSNSVPNASSSTVPGSSHALSRRRSDGSGLGGSIKRKLKVGGAYISRSISTRSQQARPANDCETVTTVVDNDDFVIVGSITPAASPRLAAPRVIQSSLSAAPGGVPVAQATLHGRSYSDTLWKRPRVAGFVSDHDVYPSSPVFAASMSELSPTSDATSSAVLSAPPGHIEVEASSKPAVQSTASSGENTKQASLPTIHEPSPSDDGQHALQSPSSPLSPTASAANDFTIPPLLLSGIPMLKVSAKKQKRYFFRLDADEGQIIWQSKKLRIIPIETIKEIRTGADARYYREQFQLAADYEDRWLTLVYIMDGSYKTLHLIAATRDVFQMWATTISRLHDIRKQLMSGLGHGTMRQAVWEKQFWKGADEENDQKLDFDDVERMCRRLNINPSREDLIRRFNAADTQNRKYLDFNDFRKFVKALKARPELDRLFKRLVGTSSNSDSYMRYPVFAAFMRDEQKVSALDEEALRKLFVKYACLPEDDSFSSAGPPSSPARNALELAIQSAAITAGMNPPQPNETLLPGYFNAAPPSTSQKSADTATSLSAPVSLSKDSTPPKLTHETGVLSSRVFTSFLLSPDNSAFHDDKHDMTKPLSEYYISSSHNTYLVGHQLVGESTIEGYIRALLHSCRSVELDIYDGELEPVIYHGKTLTTRIPLRDICQAIIRYAFVTSPYPIIISAEVHCGLVQQALIASIMSEVFGDALVKAPVEGRPKIEILPSPEDLKGMVLLKAKNLYVTAEDGVQEADVGFDTESESTSTETSASDTDFKEDMKKEIKHGLRKARENETEVLKGIKSELSKAKKVLGRVKPRRLSNNNPSLSRPPLAPVHSSSTTSSSPPGSSTDKSKSKVRMSMELVALLVYTVGVKCRGINKKEIYAPEHVFSLSESTANKILKQGMMDLIKHNRTHLVRTYPKGTRIGSTNYEPHRYWSAGCQLVAINWQTFDLGYMINHAMFQRNSRLGYVLKPTALRNADKQLLAQRTQHFLDVTIISAQQLPRPKDSLGREIIDKSILDPYVEISLHIPDWTHSPFLPPPSSSSATRSYSPPNTTQSALSATSARTVTVKTFVVKNNGFNPVWEQSLSLPFDCVGGMLDLVFVRFAVRQEDKDSEEPLAVYCTSLANLNLGYRHLALHDAQLSQYLFSMLFIHSSIRDVPVSPSSA
ncbi:hypothetical protein BDY19DRAFT_906468 [Irpex rosettiformis]|uniref:Uncharacterized protein n=1 Tax=Irpex rosettiformis TaxID=378272 RepID=A0ACB8U3Q6_9APHY|nr:hypothetical protein BDY19DRAFT_906468 [Irpex rosettiformis]